MREVRAGTRRKGFGPELRPRVEEAFGAKLIEVFGMAEGLRLETVGLPISPNDEIKIVDEQGKEVPDGQIGELITRGPYTIRGYYKAPEHNRKAFNSEGFYLTGDLARRGPHGGLIIEVGERI